MKILHLIDSGGLYGAEVMLVSLAVEQFKQEHSVVIGSIAKPGLTEKPLEHEARSRGISVKRFEMKPGPNLCGAWRVLQYARHNNFDIIHSHGYKANILLGMLPRFFRRMPFVSTLHGWTSTGKWTKMRLNELLDAFALRFVDKIILVSEGMLNKLEIQSLPQDKIVVISNGVDVMGNSADCIYTDDSMAVRVDQFCHQAITVASIGRLSTEKGYTDLIEAVAMVRERCCENIRLMLVGEGRLRSQLQDAAEAAGIGDAFLITGYVKNARRLFDSIDIYAISSLTEGLPITLLEAMASGTPIVSTAVGGISSVVKDRQEALLVPSGDPAALADGIIELICTPEYAQQLAASAKKKVVSDFNCDAMAEKYVEIYRQLVD